MSYCGEHAAVKRETYGQQAVSLRCRSWTCPDCHDLRKRQLIAEGIGGRPDTFITVTSRRHEGITAEEAAAELSHAWRILRLRIIREARRDTAKQPLPSSGKLPTVWRINSQGYVPRRAVLRNDKLPFLAVVEKHKSGWPHLHILARTKWIDWKWLSLQMWEILNSPIIRIERLFRKSKAAVYCAKYCGKATQKFQCTKRYWQSQDYDLRPEPKEKKKYRAGWGWEISNFSLEEWIAFHLSMGHNIKRIAAHRAEMHEAHGPPT